MRNRVHDITTDRRLIEFRADALDFSQEYRAAADICDKLVGQNLSENEKLARIRTQLVTAPIPATCKDRDLHAP